MSVTPSSEVTDAGLVAQLRKAGATWFRNSDLLLLEELIRRYQTAKQRINNGSG